MNSIPRTLIKAVRSRANSSFVPNHQTSLSKLRHFWYAQENTAAGNLGPQKKSVKATFSSGAVWSWFKGDSWIRFNSSGTRVVLAGDSGGSGSPQNNVFTVMAKINFTDVSSSIQTIYGSGESSTVFIFRVNTSSQIELVQPAVSVMASSTGTITTNKTYVVAATYDGATVRFYIDGIAAGSGSYSTSFTHNVQYYIGCEEATGGTRPMSNGSKIGWVAVWDKAMAVGEVAYYSKNLEYLFAQPPSILTSASSTTTTTQTITGKARITATTNRTETGVARIQITTTRTESGVARVSVAASQTETGISRITATTSRTETGVARITATTTRTINGVSRIQKTVSQTISGVSRITVSTSRTETGVSRITVTTPRTETGVSRITATTTRTITGVANIAVSGVTTQNITGVSRITATTTRTETGLARIQKTVTQTIQGTSRISLTTTKTETGVARITANTTRTETGLARITATTSRTITGVARIAGTGVTTTPLTQYNIEVAAGLSQSLPPTGNMIELEIVTSAPTDPPVNGKGVVFMVSGGVVTIYVWDGSAWRSK